jgi:hypothetical protein
MRTYIDQEFELSMDTPNGPEPIKLTCSSELMENYAVGSVIDGNRSHSVAAVRDVNGFPMTLSISSDKTLFIIMRSLQENHPTGWQQFDLTTSLGESLEVQAFGIGQEQNGDFTIAVALEDKNKRGQTHFYVTRALPDDPRKTDWAAFKDQWQARDRKGAPVKRILVGNSQMVEGGRNVGPLVVAVTEEMHEAQYYRVNGSGRWEKLDLPVNANEIQDIMIGKGIDGHGVYTFSRKVNTFSMIFTSLPDEDGDVFSIELPVPPATASLAVLAEGDDERTGLYIAGDGLYYLPVDQQEESNTSMDIVTTIADRKAVPGLKKLIVREDATHVAIWALDQENRLQYVVGEKSEQPGQINQYGPPKRWEPSIVLRHNVAEIAPIRNQLKEANDLVMIGRDKNLTHLSQDPTTSIWNGKDVPLLDTGKLQTFNCYTTQINLSKDDSPVRDRTFRLAASEWCEVTINGVSHVLDSKNTLEVKTDMQGNITIINKADGISTPIFRIVECPEPINPALKIKKGLETIKTVDDLKNARRQNGKPLVAPSVKEEDLKEAAKGIHNLNEISNRLPQDGSVSRFYLSNINAEDLPPDCWGMSLSEDGEMRYYEGDEAMAMMRAALSMMDDPAIRQDTEDIWDALWKFAGDVLEWMKNAVEKAAEFIIRKVQEAWEFVVKIGQQAFKFVVECLGQAANIFNWLLKKTLGLDLKDMMDWLGFLFAWEDILRTHKVMTNVARQTLKYGESQIDYLKKEIHRSFDELIKMAENIKPVAGERGGANLKRESSSQNINAKLPENGKRTLEFITKSPGGNFGSYQLLYGGALKANVSDEISYANSELELFFKNTLEPFLTGITETVQTLGNDLKEIFEKGQLTPNEVIGKLSSTAIRGILRTLRDVVVGILNVFQELLKGIQKFLDYDLPIPFLSAFFEKITGGRKLTLLEGLMLLFAIPSTIGYKILTGKAPFSAGTDGLDTDDHVTLFNKFRNPSVMQGDNVAPSAVQIYSYIGGFLSAVITWVSSAVDAGLSGAGSKMPGWVNLILGVIQTGCTIPIGKWNFGRVAGWAVKWFAPIRSLYDIFAPAEVVFSGAFQILIGIVKAIFDVVKFIQEIAGRWELVIWGAAEDLLLLASDGLGGGAKIAPESTIKAALAVLAFGAAHFRGSIAIARMTYTVTTES